MILLGNTACGKTACYETLSRALCQFYYPWLQSKDLPNKKISEKLERINVKVIYPNVFKTEQVMGTHLHYSGRISCCTCAKLATIPHNLY